MTLEWNFIGSSVVNWYASYRFYHQVLGWEAARNPAYGDEWAVFGGGWDVYYADSNGTVFELFNEGKPALTTRTWGNGQGYRPAIHVQDLDTAIAYFQQRGVIFTSEIETCAWGRRCEFLAPESIYLTLLEPFERPTTAQWSQPIIGTVDIRVHDMAAQTAFYSDVLGFQIVANADAGVVLRQPTAIGADKPQLILEAGGEPVHNHPDWSDDPVRGQPFFLSMMTDDIESYATHLRTHDVTVLKEIQSHADWNGTDLHIADADGNAIQIVQYHQ